MMLKIAYMGEKFNGFARQPNVRTVEGDLLKALKKIGYTTKVYAASRTDKGVSALSNVIKVDFKKDICRMLTALLEDIWVYQYSFEDKNPRYCTKHYTYFLPEVYDTKRVTTCCHLFSGVHDFSAFTRAKGNTIKEIAVSFEVKDGVTLFHFTGKSFLWEMIRRCITGMKDYLSGKMTEHDVVTLLQGVTTKGKVPPAPAENLLLKELLYPFSFFTDQFSAKKMRESFLSQYMYHAAKKSLFEICLNY